MCTRISGLFSEYRRALFTVGTDVNNRQTFVHHLDRTSNIRYRPLKDFQQSSEPYHLQYDVFQENGLIYHP